jgi:hypothetical protein
MSNPNEMVRIISGGIYMTVDGGQTWKTGITGEGMNSSYLTAGQINTEKMFIWNGSNPSFKWDSAGISAYKFDNGYGYDSSTFVRFDHNGIYSLVNYHGEDSSNPLDIDTVLAKAPFSLTWRGLQIQNDDGSVKISSENDIQVLDKARSERIKIGRIGKLYEPTSDTSFQNGVAYYEYIEG